MGSIATHAAVPLGDVEDDAAGDLAPLVGERAVVLGDRLDQGTERADEVESDRVGTETETETATATATETETETETAAETAAETETQTAAAAETAAETETQTAAEAETETATATETRWIRRWSL